MNISYNILAFEAATQICSVAVCVNGRIFSRLEKTPKRSSEVLLPMINELLIEAGMTINQLDLIAVGYGPGSFMGVRLAVGVAQGLAFAHNTPLIGVSTLGILAQTAFQKFQWPSVLVAWDARMHEMYYGVYQLNEAGIMCATKKDQLIAPSQYLSPKGDYSLVGNAWSVYYSDFSTAFKNQFDKDTVKNSWIYPNSESLLTIANARYRNKHYAHALDLSPVYLRNKVA